MTQIVGPDDRREMDRVAAGLPTKSAKIRALGRAGFRRADIARYLGIRYQHVRNVLVQAAPQPNMPASTERPPMEGLVRGLETKSAKIRALSEAGYTRSEIANFLDIRYQHVWNVLAQPQPSSLPKEVMAKVGPGGRIVIPIAYRNAMGVEEGDEITVRLEGDELHLLGARARVRRAREMVAKYIDPEVSLVDDLIAERRREAAREDAGG